MARSRIFFLVICGIFALIALGIGWGRQVGTFAVETDFYGVYAPQAEGLLAGKPYTYQLNPPGYTLLLAGVTLGLGNTFTAAKIISTIAWACLGLVILTLLESVVAVKLARPTAALSLISLFPASFLAATDVVGALLMLLPLGLFLSAPSLGLLSCFFMGVLSGLAYLFRANAIFIPLGIIVCIFLFNLTAKKWLKVGIFLAGFILTFTPWLWYDWHFNGNFLASTAFIQIAAHFHHPLGDNFTTSMQEVSGQYRSLSEVFLADPFKVIKKYSEDVLFLNIPRMFIPSVVIDQFKPIIIFPLLWVYLGLILLLKNIQDFPAPRKLLSFILISFLGYLLLGLIGFHRRYYFFFYPCIFLLKVYLLSQLPWPRKSKIKALLLGSLFLGVTATAIIETYLTLKQEPRYLLSISEFLRQTSPPKATIIVRKPHLAYLSGLTPSFPLASNAREYLAKAQEVGARYIVYSQAEAQLWPGLESLQNPEQMPEKLKLVYQHPPSHTLIYEVIND